VFRIKVTANNKTISYVFEDFYIPVSFDVMFWRAIQADHCNVASFRLTTTKGRELIKALNKYKCEAISTGKPTYWPTDPGRIPDLLDFFITKNLSSNYIKIEDNLELGSDHSPITLTLSECVIQIPCNPMLVNKKTDWDGFRTAIDERMQLMVPLQTEEQLDFEVNKFVNDIQQSAWDNTPEIKKRLKGNNYPSEILELISEKRKQRKKWHQTRAPQEKTRLNNLSYQLKEAIKQLKNDTVSNFLRDLTNDSSTDYSLWKTTKTSLSPPRFEMGTFRKRGLERYRHA
jgi:hypothetical protein